MHTVLSRQAAVTYGQRFFYTGRPCIHGHDCPRYTSTGNCVECHKTRGKLIASNLKKGQVARLRGHFSYDLHPDDHAAALAYCQALDMQRGVIPKSAPPVAVRTRITPEEVEARRQWVINGGMYAAPRGPAVDRDDFPPMSN